MARYSVAETRNNLSQLIDRALAGEDVIVTRHGKPTVLLSVVPKTQAEIIDERLAKRREWMTRLEKLRESMPKPKLSYMRIKRLEQAEMEH
jgi:prevent-host-death family protein